MKWKAAHKHARRKARRKAIARAIIRGLLNVEAYNDQFRQPNPDGRYPACKSIVGDKQGRCERCGNLPTRMVAVPWSNSPVAIGDGPCPAVPREQRWGESVSAPFNRGDLPDRYTALVDTIRASEAKSYRLSWTGTNVPRGLRINGQPIVGVQNRIIYIQGENGLAEDVAYYTRTIEGAGPSRDGYEMLISTRHAIEAGPGQTIEKVRDMPIALPSLS